MISKTNFSKKILKLIMSGTRLALLIGISYIIIYPFLVKLSVAFMDKRDLYDVTVKWVPKHFTLENIRLSSEVINLLPTLMNTLFLCTIVTILQVSTCTMAAYGLARFRFKLREPIFFLIILTLMIPPQTYIVALYTQFKFFDIFGIIKLFTGGRGLNLINGYTPFLILSATGMGIKNGLFIFIMRQIFRGFPKEIEEAAKIDGAKTFSVFTKIMVPNAVPSMIIVALLSFVWQWNDVFYITLFAPDIKMLSSVLLSFPNTISNYLGGWSNADPLYTSVLINAGSLIIVMPLLIVFFVLQKRLIASVERSGLVG